MSGRPARLNVAQAVCTVLEELPFWSGIRAVQRVFMADPSIADTLEASLRSAVAGAIVVRVREDEASAEVLSDLNLRRGAILGDAPLVAHIVTNGAEYRALRTWANDLTSVVDGLIEVMEAPGWRLLLGDLKRALADRHREIDLSSYLRPRFGELRIPLAESFVMEAGIEGWDEPGFLDRPTLALGIPGSGRTTALRFLCLQVASDASERLLPADVVLALYMPLARWWIDNLDRTTHLQDSLERYAGFLLGRERVGFDGDLAGVALLLDGLDEIPEPLRERALEEAAGLREAGARVLVTGRALTLYPLILSTEGEWDNVGMRAALQTEMSDLYRRIAPDAPKSDLQLDWSRATPWDTVSQALHRRMVPSDPPRPLTVHAYAWTRGGPMELRELAWRVVQVATRVVPPLAAKRAFPLWGDGGMVLEDGLMVFDQRLHDFAAAWLFTSGEEVDIDLTSPEHFELARAMLVLMHQTVERARESELLQRISRARGCEAIVQICGFMSTWAWVRSPAETRRGDARHVLLRLLGEEVHPVLRREAQGFVGRWMRHVEGAPEHGDPLFDALNEVGLPRWGEVSRARSLFFPRALPRWFSERGRDPDPLLHAWLDDPDPAVRAMAWPGSMSHVARVLDPELDPRLMARSGDRPDGLRSAVLARRYGAAFGEAAGAGAGGAG